MCSTTVHFLINLPSQHKFLRGFNGENQRGTELSDSGTDCRGQLDYGSLSNLHQERIPKIQGSYGRRFLSNIFSTLSYNYAFAV